MSNPIYPARDLEANWSVSVTPLQLGELAFSTDNPSVIRCGDGVNIPSALPLTGLSGPSAGSTSQYGNGYMGDLALSSGSFNSTEDTYWNSITFSGGSFYTNNFRHYVKTILDIANATIYAIQSFSTSSGTIASSGNGGSASSGALFNGSVGFPDSAQWFAGGMGGKGGRGGNSNSGGWLGAVPSPPLSLGGRVSFARYVRHFLSGITLVYGGSGGTPGGTGGGDGTNRSGATSSGGRGNPNLVFFAHTIHRSSLTPQQVIISSIGDQGGDAAVGDPGGSSGGSGGSGGGGGGFVYICFHELTGSQCSGAIASFGGNGGNGANGIGLGDGGDGGDGGHGGYCCLVNTGARTVTVTPGTAGTAGMAAVGQTGGLGGSGGVLLATL